MKHLLCLVLLYWVGREKLLAQETIYLANGNRYPGKLVGTDGDRLRIAVQKGGKTTVYPVRRENVLLVFKQNGNYRLIKDFDDDSLKAQAQIEEFDQAPAPALAYDLLLKTSPATVLPGTISYESDEVVNFKSPKGEAATINKRELAAIFYRDGRHRLVQKTAEVTTAINSTRRELLEWSRPVVVAAAPNPPVVKKPVAKPPVKAKAVSQVKAKPKLPAAEKKASLASVPAAPPPAVAPSAAAAPPAAPAKKPVLNESEYQEYRTSSLNRVEEFSLYLKIIVDETVAEDDKDKAIATAVGMFTPDATIEVSSNNRNGTRKYPVEVYLKRLKGLPYAKTNLEWNEIQYVSELKQADDGKYYGTISGQQTFTGYAENGEVLYSDVTEKNVKVILDSYTKTKDGKVDVKWNVLLGSIGISRK